MSETTRCEQVVAYFEGNGNAWTTLDDLVKAIGGSSLFLLRMFGGKLAGTFEERRQTAYPYAMERRLRRAPEGARRE